MGYRHKEVITASLMLRGISHESQAADSLREQEGTESTAEGYRWENGQFIHQRKERRVNSDGCIAMVAIDGFLLLLFSHKIRTRSLAE